MDPIGNRTFNELRPGVNASLTRTFEMRDVGVFAAMSGNILSSVGPMTPLGIDDASHVGPAFDQLTVPVEVPGGDGAYDRTGTDTAVAARLPEAAVIAPPR